MGRRVRLVGGLVAGIALLLPASATAAPATVEKMPFEATVFACDTTISLSGTMLAVVNQQQLRNSGFLLTFHFQPQGVSGTSSNGATYHETGGMRSITVFTPADGGTETFINRFHIVGTAGAPTYYVKETFHVTVPPSGSFTAFVDDFSVDCS